MSDVDGRSKQHRRQHHTFLRHLLLLLDQQQRNKAQYKDLNAFRRSYKKSQETLLYPLHVLPKRSRDFSAQDCTLANQMPPILLTFPRMFFDVRFCFKSNQRRRSKSRRIIEPNHDAASQQSGPRWPPLSFAPLFPLSGRATALPASSTDRPSPH